MKQKPPESLWRRHWREGCCFSDEAGKSRASTLVAVKILGNLSQTEPSSFLVCVSFDYFLPPLPVGNRFLLFQFRKEPLLPVLTFTEHCGQSAYITPVQCKVFKCFRRFGLRGRNVPKNVKLNSGSRLILATTTKGSICCIVWIF